MAEGSGRQRVARKRTQAAKMRLFLLFSSLGLLLLAVSMAHAQASAEGATSGDATAERTAEQRQLLEQADRLSEEATRLYEQGDTLGALEPASEEVRIRTEILGEEHPDTAASVNDLGLLYESMGDYAKAEPLLREGVRIRRRNLELSFAVQSERQQLRMVESSRGALNAWLSVAPRAGVTAENSYAEMLAWKGIVFAGQARARFESRTPGAAALVGGEGSPSSERASPYTWGAFVLSGDWR